MTLQDLSLSDLISLRKEYVEEIRYKNHPPFNSEDREEEIAGIRDKVRTLSNEIRSREAVLFFKP